MSMRQFLCAIVASLRQRAARAAAKAFDALSFGHW
jgi:hypothetical protein